MSVVDRYLELALRLGKHDEDLVDSFAGPEELAQRVEAEGLRDPAALAEDAEALLAELGDDPWLAAQARALWGRMRGSWPASASSTPRRAAWSTASSRAGTTRRPSAGRPGCSTRRSRRTATCGARYAGWLEETAIPRELLEGALLDVAAELRRLTRERIGLPDGEGSSSSSSRGALARVRRVPGRPAHEGLDQRRPAASRGRPRAPHLARDLRRPQHASGLDRSRAGAGPRRCRADTRPPLGA